MTAKAQYRSASQAREPNVQSEHKHTLEKPPAAVQAAIPSTLNNIVLSVPTARTIIPAIITTKAAAKGQLVEKTNAALVSTPVKVTSVQGEANSPSRCGKRTRETNLLELTPSKKKVKSCIKSPVERRRMQILSDPKVFQQPDVNLPFKVDDDAVSSCASKDNSSVHAAVVALSTLVDVKSTSLVAESTMLEEESRVPEAACQLAAWGLPDTILAQYAEKGITTMFPWQVCPAL